MSDGDDDADFVFFLFAFLSSTLSTPAVGEVELIEGGALAETGGEEILILRKRGIVLGRHDDDAGGEKGA